MDYRMCTYANHLQLNSEFKYIIVWYHCWWYPVNDKVLEYKKGKIYKEGEFTFHSNFIIFQCNPEQVSIPIACKPLDLSAFQAHHTQSTAVAILFYISSASKPIRDLNNLLSDMLLQ